MNCGVILVNQSSMKIKQVNPGYTLPLCTHRGPSVKDHVVKSAAGIAGVTLPRAINPPPSCILLASAPDEKQTILHYFLL